MSTRVIHSILIPLLLTATACVQKRSHAKWYRGNIHTHTYWSDGDDYPEMVIGWYADHGYDFIALSDHNILQEGEKWIEVVKESVDEETFKNYLENYGLEWVDFEEKENSYRVRLKTLDEFRSIFEQKDEFLIVNSEEITDRYEDKPVHLNATNIQELIEPQGGGSVAEVMQNNIDAVIEQREATEEPVIPHINHPNFGWAITAEDLKQLEGERFMEIYNGHPLVNNYGGAGRSGAEEIWDEVLTHYLLEGKPAIYGIAVDDAHNYQQFDSTQSNPGRGWIRVRSSQLSPDSLISAMERGDFYASTGVRLAVIRYDGRTLRIRIDGEEGVEYTTRFLGTRKHAPEETGVLLKSANGTRAEYTLDGEELYVRAKILSDKLKANPYAEGEMETAWTQPVSNGGAGTGKPYRE